MDTQNQGLIGGDVLGKQVFWGLDLGDPKGDYGVTARCHRDTEGVLIIDSIEYTRDTEDD